MAPKQPSAPAGPDSFELAGELIRRGRRTWIMTVLALCTTVLMAFALVLQAAKPMSVVVWSDDPNREAMVVVTKPGESQVRAIDCQRFAVRFGNNTMAWNSATVSDELNKALLLMTPKWKKVFEDQLNKKVPVPESIDASGQSTVFGTYLKAMARNSVEWDWARSQCAKVEGVWNCKLYAQIETQPMTGAPLTSPDTKRKVEIQAQFIEVPVTVNTIDGLLVDFWNQVDL